MIAGCLSNNRRAQEQLYRQLYAFAITIAIRYSKDQVQAKDILSSAFVKMFKHLQFFDKSKGSFHAWLKKIITNEAIDYIKQSAKFNTVELEKTETPIIENTVFDKINEGALLLLIQQLPPATNAVFILYVLDGYPHKEIAEKLNISEGTSKWHLSEARKLLQQKIRSIKK